MEICKSDEQITITISTPPPSLNVLLRMHYRERVKLKRRIRLEVFAQLAYNRLLGISPFPHPVKITGVRYGKQPLDYDNLIGSLKPVIDALRWNKVIKDDSPIYVSFGKIQQKKLGRGEVSRLELTITKRR